MSKLKLFLETVSLGAGALATFDAPIASRPITRFGNTKVYDVSDMKHINNNIRGKKKYSRWKKQFGEDYDYSEIKKDYNRKKDILLREPKSGIMVYLRKKDK